jgi:hypothetical protein
VEQNQQERNSGRYYLTETPRPHNGGEQIVNCRFLTVGNAMAIISLCQLHTPRVGCDFFYGHTIPSHHFVEIEMVDGG